tara:strand:+ start:843 stop:2093 length:1251 start_codon:yes stop_codon:yes gene_type:complete
MSIISKLELDVTKMSTDQISRTIKVRGKIGAKFFIILTKSGTIKFYDWTTETFIDGHAPKNNLTVTMTSNYFQRNVVFPEGVSGGGTYVLKLITTNNTKTTAGFNVISKNIEKSISNTTLTFKPASLLSSTRYATLPSVTAIGASNNSVTTPYSFTVSTASTDAGGFGIRSIFGSQDLEELGDQLNTLAFVDSLVYYQTTKTITTNLFGDGVSSTQIVVSDLTDLAVGTEVYFHQGSTKVANKTTILSIKEDAKTLVFDNAVAFAEGETITFRAYGVKNIDYALGARISFSTIKIDAFSEVVKTLRTDVSSSTTLNLNNTLGIPGGNIIGISGVGVNNSSSNKVTSVTPDPTGGDGDGSIVVQVAQNLTQGTSISFPDTFTSISFSGSITTTLFPGSNKEINIDLDQILLTGTSGL